MKQINAYLFFDGNCREAIGFYHQCLGGDLMLSPYSDAPMETPLPERIMHSRITIDGNIVLMASDSMPGRNEEHGTDVSHGTSVVVLSLACDSVEEIDRYFAALSEGGHVTMALGDTFWGARFGMLVDKFGFHWMLNFDYPK